MDDTGETWKYSLRVSYSYTYINITYGRKCKVQSKRLCLLQVNTFQPPFQQSAETLLVTLFKEYRKCVEVFLSIVNEFQAPLTDASDLPNILAKDALYNAAGIVAYELYDEVIEF
jgi:hypothetical protein